MVNKDLCFMIMFKLIKIILILFGRAGLKDVEAKRVKVPLHICPNPITVISPVTLTVTARF